MSRLEREEFIKAAERAAEPKPEGRRVMTGGDATEWMAAQGG